MKGQSSDLRLNRTMGAIDTSKLPSGSQARAALVAALEAGDDRVESHYLEVKSGFDLNSKADRRKVIKFILGAAHRDPGKAARHFGEHALMILGLPLDGVRGVEKFDVKDLAADIATFIGADPPGWDLDRVPVGDGRDVVLIIVDPPDGRIWPVLQSSDSLVTGDVYMRAEGETRRISGPELVVLLSRAQDRNAPSVLDVSIAAIGTVDVLVIDSAELSNFVEWLGERLETQVNASSTLSPFAPLQASFSSDRRSEQEFLTQVDEWRAAALESPSSGVHKLASQMTRPFRLEIVNNTTTSLREVRLDVTFDSPVTALYWQEQENTVVLFEDKPRDWGSESYLSAVSLSGIQPVLPAHAYDSEIRIAEEHPAELVVEIKRLHAEQKVITPDDDVVLVLFADDPSEVRSTVRASWRLAAGEVNDVLKGEFELEVRLSDWREPLHSVISRLRGDTIDEDEDED